jgi:hypothetical protein
VIRMARQLEGNTRRYAAGKSVPVWGLCWGVNPCDDFVWLSMGLDLPLCKIFFAVSFTYLGIHMISLSNWPQIIIQLKLLYCLQLKQTQRT